jgi:hypothetical protein
METPERVETVEIDAGRFISLEFTRPWPRYVVAWMVRQTAGDSDFPLASGSVESMPQRGAQPDTLWDTLRDQAISQAMQAAAAAAPAGGPKGERRSLLSRLLGRR